MDSSKKVSFHDRPTDGEAGVAESVRTNTDLEELIIYGEWFGDDDAEELGAALAHNTSLKALDVCTCSFGSRGLRGIAEALKTSRVVKAMFHGNRGIGDDGAEVLADLLLSTLSSLTELSMEGCGVREKGARVIADALKVNRTLEVFNISNNKIGDAGVAALADALAVHSSLKRFDAYGGCGIGALGSSAIADALQTISSLERLSMNGDEIGDAGTMALADALATTTSLTHLDLGTCGIGKRGAVALGRAWGSNLALSMDFHLNTYFWHSPIRYEAHRARAFALRRREQLLAFGMVMIERLGGGTDEQAVLAGASSTRRSPFHAMDKDVFKLIGEAYGDC
jgi:Ran GTPase-activating protein (RanGAP) involved in mRNA processing and transport